jgi:chromosomal replication initiator protein
METKIDKETQITIDIIQYSVCLFYRTDIETLLTFNKIRRRNFVVARMLIMYFIGKHTKLTTTQNGFIFKKDHSTVIHANKTIRNLMSTDKTFKNEVADISDVICLKLNKYKGLGKDSEIVFIEENLICL